VDSAILFIVKRKHVSMVTGPRLAKDQNSLIKRKIKRTVLNDSVAPRESKRLTFLTITNKGNPIQIKYTEFRINPKRCEIVMISVYG